MIEGFYFFPSQNIFLASIQIGVASFSRDLGILLFKWTISNLQTSDFRHSPSTPHTSVVQFRLRLPVLYEIRISKIGTVSELMC